MALRKVSFCIASSFILSSVPGKALRRNEVRIYVLEVKVEPTRQTLSVEKNHKNTSGIGTGCCTKWSVKDK